MKTFSWFITTVLIVLMWVVVIFSLPSKLTPHDPQIQALQAEMQALRAEMEDVKSVQGYRSWEMDWRNRRDGQ